MSRLLFSTLMLRAMPPWLRRLIGGAVVQGIGQNIETELARNSDGVILRFPGDGESVPTDPDSIGLIGRERRILRGPVESDVSYAARLILWWDSHRTRGGPYALLGQMFPYFLDFLNVPMQIVGNTGIRHLLDIAGNITRDAIVWGNVPTFYADGTGKWARLWVMINLPDTLLSVPLLTESGEPVLTGSGEPVLVTVSIFTLSALEEEMLCAVPREWNAAHVDEVHVILLYPGAELWGYRITDDPASSTTIGTWADTDPSPGQAWQSTDPIDIQCV